MTDELEPTIVEEAPPELTAAALLTERRAEAARLELERQRRLNAVSPPCVRELKREGGKSVTCGHKLNRHDPCSLCVCPGFLSKEGERGTESAARVRRDNPDLFPISENLPQALDED